MSAREFLRRKIGDPIVQQLRQGLSPEKIALTVAFGLCIAIFPVVGGTTILCFLAAWAFRLNVPIIQAINWSSYALQLLMIFPFIRLGEKIFRSPRVALSLDQLVGMARADPFDTLARLWTTIWHAVAAWAIVAPLLIGAIYYATRGPFRALARRIAAARDKAVDDVA
jgi:uncharacterized protein (DUF2062 family)